MQTRNTLRRRPEVEALEDRFLPATFAPVVTSSFQWFTAGNQPPINVPQVDLGPDRTVSEVSSPNSIALKGSFKDDTAASSYPTVFRIRKNSNYVEDVYLSANAVTKTFEYNAALSAGTYVVTAEVSNGKNTGYDTMVLTVLPNIPPPLPLPKVPLVDAGPDVTVTEGAWPNVIGLRGSFKDDSGAKTFVSSFTVIRMDGSFVQNGAVFADADARTLTYNAFQLRAGDYVVKLEVNNGQATGFDTLVVRVLQNPPQSAPLVLAPRNAVIDEGGVFTGTYSFSDADGGRFQVRIAFGDGSPDLQLKDVSPGTFNLTRFFYQDSQAKPDGVYRNTITVTDATGLATSANFDVTVRNIVPVVIAPPVVQTYPNPWVWGSATISARFRDPGAETNFTSSYTVTSLGGQKVQSGPGFMNAATKTATYYLTGLLPGDYLVRLHVADDRGMGSAQVLFRVTLFYVFYPYYPKLPYYSIPSPAQGYTTFYPNNSAYPNHPYVQYSPYDQYFMTYGRNPYYY